jgi:hypothetical protein
MITVGLVKELEFMSRAMEEDISLLMWIAGRRVGVEVSENRVVVSYGGEVIWDENVHGEGNWFGIESCDTIYRIIKCIDKEEPWKEKYEWKKSDNTCRKPLNEAVVDAEEIQT